MDIANHNWAYLPKKWHDAMGSTAYNEKINLTKFFKWLFEECSAPKSIGLQGDTKHGNSEIYNHVGYLLKHVVYLPSTGNIVLFNLLKSLRQINLDDEDVIQFSEISKTEGRRMLEMTLSELKDEYGIQLYSENATPNTSQYLQSFNEGLYEGSDVIAEGENSFGIKAYLLSPEVRLSEIINEFFFYFPSNFRYFSAGFTSPTYLSNAMCHFLDVPPGTMESRTEVTRSAIVYIQSNSLQDNQNRKVIHPDAKLLALVGTEAERLSRMEQRALVRPSRNLNVTSELTFFNLQLHLNQHFLKEPEYPKWPQEVLREILEFSDTPPIANHVYSLYRRGGYGFHENWQDLSSKMSESTN